jgi:hypothetical protein
MDSEREQPSLWGQQDELHGHQGQLDRAREEWQRARRRHAIGSEEEVSAWEGYRAASDRLWELIQRQR